MHHKARTTALAVGTALIIGTTGFAVAQGDDAGKAGAGAAQAVKTLKFSATTDREMGAGMTGFLATEIEKNAKGKKVGFDVISGVFNSTNQSLTVYVAIARNGGLLYGNVVAEGENDTTFEGKVTGGAGKFKGAKGTIVAEEEAGNDDVVQITVKYQLP